MLLQQAKRVKISKKFLSELPLHVADVIRALAEEYDLHSLSYAPVAEQHRFYAMEADRYVIICNEETVGAEFFSEATIGVNGLAHPNGEFTAPIGSYVVLIEYYNRYQMYLYNVQPKALS